MNKLVVGLCGFSLFIISGCSTPKQILMVKSEPAEADVCIKGKAGSEYFSQEKQCVGSTPFEADQVEVTTKNGEKKTVKFSDLKKDGENFYVVLSRKGYSSESRSVPGWDQFLVLHQEATAPVATAANEAPLAPLASHDPAAKPSVRIDAIPSGALLYIDNAVKGNAPFVYQGNAGEAIHVKLEIPGYESLEKTIKLGDVGSDMLVTLQLKKTAEAPIAQAIAKPQSQAIKAQAGTDRAVAAESAHASAPASTSTDDASKDE